MQAVTMKEKQNQKKQSSDRCVVVFGSLPAGERSGEGLEVAAEDVSTKMRMS